MWFKVLVGQHNEYGKTYGPTAPDGPYVDSKSDLSKLNYPNSHKFERMSADDVQRALKSAKKQETLQNVAAMDTSTNAVLETVLSKIASMGEADLAKAAEEMGVDLSRCKTKADKIKALQTAAQED